MAQVLPPLAVALVLWWASTGALLWLVRRPERTFAPMLGLGGVVAVAALAAAWLSRGDMGEVGVYTAFAAALIVWGWHEAAFLMGVLTGPKAAVGGGRFRAAAAAVIHHEVALAATLAVLAGLTWGGANQTAPLTFAALFALRLSSKFNLFLGVPNPPTALLPSRLAHLAQHFRRRAFNPLMPVSLAVAGTAAVLLARAALAPGATPGEATAAALLFTLVALGLIEHLFLLMPSPDRALWGWALGRKTEPTLALADVRTRT